MEHNKACLDYFDRHVKPRLAGCSFEYAQFTDGQFGDLDRIEILSDAMVAGVDIWTLGWLGIDVFDIRADEPVMTLLWSPDETIDLPACFSRLINAFCTPADPSAPELPALS